MDNVPPIVPNAFRVILTQTESGERLDSVLMKALRDQSENAELKNLTRTQFKKLFEARRIQIKGQAARPSSSIAKGTTYVDVLGFK